MNSHGAMRNSVSLFRRRCGPIQVSQSSRVDSSRMFPSIGKAVAVHADTLCFHSLVPLVAAIGLIGVPITGDDQANHHLECYSAAAVATATATATAAAIWPQINTILIRVVGRIDLSLLMNQERRGTPTLNKI
ncbi:hypothetical protein BLOT_004866 [Blomia tropicalis]|nr:hypothetical protein BLOT_004866 [Blomia tropicalis]